MLSIIINVQLFSKIERKILPPMIYSLKLFYTSNYSLVSPRSWVAPITNVSPPDTVSKASTPRRLVVVEPNHSWWLIFQSTTNMKYARHPLPAWQPLMLGSIHKTVDQSRSGLLMIKHIVGYWRRLWYGHPSGNSV